MGQIFAHYTCTRVRWEQDEDGFTHEDPVEEHGWLDRGWSPYVLHDSRNDVRPAVSLDEDDPELVEECMEALGWLEGGFEDNGNGTFYSADSYQPFDQEWSYSYALHFVRKSYGLRGWVEEPYRFVPVT